MRLKSFIILFFVLMTKLSFAQTYILKGIVKDTSGQDMVGATAVLLRSQDSILAYYNITNSSGYFQMAKVKPGSYLFQVSYLGYASFNLSVDLNDENYTRELGEITLQPESKNLKEVVVTSDRVPISINRDTIEYHADAFKTQENSAVEDLIKKLPGMEVEDDGTIKAKGKTVQKVLVDGKEFFGDDPQITTKNLPAKAIKKVQVYDKKSEMSEFTGIDDGERETTVNLTLKDTHKRGKFGNITAGYGSEERFQLGTNFNAFSDKTKISFIGAGNNINQQNFSMRDYFNFMGGLSSISSGGGGGGRRITISLDGGEGPGGFGGNRGINRLWSAGLNITHTFNPKLDLTTSYFNNFLNNNLQSNLFRQNILDPDQIYYSDIETQQNNKSGNHRWSSDLFYRIDSTQDLRWRNSVNYNQGRYRNLSLTDNYFSENQVITTGQRLNSNTGSSSGFTSSLVYRKKLNNKGTAMTLNGSIGYNPGDSEGDLLAVNSFLEGFSYAIDSILQNFNQQNKGLLYNTRLSFTFPLTNRWSLESHAELRNNDTELDRKVYDLVYSPVFDSDLNELLSREYNQEQNYQTAGLTFSYKRKKWNINTGSDLRRTRLYGKLTQVAQPVQQSFINTLPFLRMNYEFSTSRAITFEYNTRVNEPSLQQLQPIIDNSDPLNVYAGNPQLRPEFIHEGNLNFNYFNQFSNINLFAFINGSIIENSIVNTQTVDSLFRKFTKPVNTNQAYRLNSNINFGFPLKFLRSRGNLSFNGFFARNEVYVNGLLNDITSFTRGIRLNISDRNSEVFEYSWGGNLNFTHVGYSVNENLNNDYYNYRLFANGTLNIAKSWALNSSFSYNRYVGSNLGQNTTFPLWNARISKFFANRKYELRLAVQDLLKRNTGIIQQTNLNYIDYEETNVLGRYGLISFIYGIRKFGRR